jgi:hypothetical protein
LPASIAFSDGTALKLRFSPFLVRPELRGVKSQATAKEIATKLNSKASLVALFMGMVLGFDLLGQNGVNEANDYPSRLGGPHVDLGKDQLRLLND